MSDRYIATAADILFNSERLDNSIRGVYVEALIFSALRFDARWRYVGVGWGPWDLQRGTHRERSRIRVQVKTKAYDQLWPSPNIPRYEYDLGWKTEPLGYFRNYYDEPTYGDCEPEGFRCELFLFAWHGPDLEAPPHEGLFPHAYSQDQRDPNNYVYSIRRTKELTSSRLHVVKALNGQRLKFDDLPTALNDAADKELGC